MYLPAETICRTVYRKSVIDCMSEEYDVLAGYVLPHPPVIVPGVNRGPHEAAATEAAMRQLAGEFARIRPETVVILSPHAPMFSDYLFMYDATVLTGSLGRFGAGQASLSLPQDQELHQEIRRCLELAGINGGSLSPEQMRRHQIEAELDHGVVVPLYFLAQAYSGFKLVALSCSNLPLPQIYQAGSLIRQAAARLNRRIVIIASGDQSHKVNEQSPYGVSPEGAQYDAQVAASFRDGDLVRLLSIDVQVRQRSAECGYRSLVMLCGAFSRRAVRSRLVSYEAPYGIGYCVAALHSDPERPEPIDDVLELALSRQRELNDARRKQASPPVQIARQTLEAYVREHQTCRAGDFSGLTGAEFLFREQAGAFVSLKKFGELRGCIGTTAPTTDSLADEIVQNALSAGLRDPRFEPVTAGELADLVYSVDVLGTAEPIADKSELDPAKYGVIVRSGSRSGLLLPDLEGVDTVEEQLAIACRKAGIRAGEPYQMLRFQVTRYT
ncbi:MAG TPA: AMMECR1 domain-containing protein [Clostridiales bacterium]|nr:AMMECR1 domain-containing protein [Clostridiales bacterium]